MVAILHSALEFALLRCYLILLIYILFFLDVRESQSSYRRWDRTEKDPAYYGIIEGFFFSLIFNMFIVSVFTKKVLFNDVVAIIKKIIYWIVLVDTDVITLFFTLWNFYFVIINYLP